MSARAEILHRLQLRNVEKQPLPPIDGTWTTYEQPSQQFESVLKQVGGESLRIDKGQDILQALIASGSVDSEHRCISTLPGSELPKLSSPVDAADFDVSIVNGAFGVAENAAIWLLDHGTEPHRSCLFLVGHLVLVIKCDSIVNNMHEAYERIGKWPNAGFGIFISGPSKTADIEQSLVIGAQGPRRHTVVMVDS